MKKRIEEFINDEGRRIVRVIFPPVGEGNDLQRAMSDLMSARIREDGKCTLAELGYYHMSVCMYSQTNQAYDLRAYFNPGFCVRPVKDRSDPRYGKLEHNLAPVMEFNAFSGYLFVGDIQDVSVARAVVSFEKSHVPKHDEDEDGLGHKSLKILSFDKMKLDTVMCLHCNLSTTMAAIVGASLSDPYFSVKCETIGSIVGGSDKVVLAVNNEVPVRITVEYSAKNDPEADEYDPDEAVPYLMSLRERAAKKEKARATIVKTAAKTAKSKRAEIRRGSAFGRYS